MAFEVSGDRLIKEVESRAALLGAGGQHGPDAFAPAAAGLAASPLDDFAVDHHKAEPLLDGVIGWLHTGSLQEAKVVLGVSTKPLALAFTLLCLLSVAESVPYTGTRCACLNSSGEIIIRAVGYLFDAIRDVVSYTGLGSLEAICRLVRSMAHERPTTRVRRGFTLVELLVVIAIIGVLVALLLPAIQSAREAARRSQCKNNLRQLGIAAQMFHDSYKFFPSAGWGDWWVGCPDQPMGERQPGSWAYQLLAFIEESARRRWPRLQVRRSELARAIGQMVSTPISVFYCPSRRAAQGYPLSPRDIRNYDPPPLAGKSDYAGNVGDVPFVGTDVGPASIADYDSHDWQYSGPRFVAKVISKSNCLTGHTGVIFQRSTIEFRQITDGTSRTYLIGEKNLDPNNYTDGGALNDDQSMYTGWDKDNLRATTVILLPSGSPIGYLASPDTPGSEKLGSWWQWRFGGPHPGGWQSVFCDGSVHFLSYDMDPMIHDWLGNRQDGNTIDESEL